MKKSGLTVMHENLEELLPNPFSVDYQHGVDPLDLYTEKELERFARRIIYECIELVKHIRMDVDDGRYTVSAADEIKTHFGLE